jgi:hypothetical protein
LIDISKQRKIQNTVSPSQRRRKTDDNDAHATESSQTLADAYHHHHHIKRESIAFPPVVPKTTMSAPTDDQKSTRSNSNSNDLTLVDAMKVADSIRKHYNDSNGEKEKNESRNIPPGLMQGLSAFCIAGVALLPVRRVILSSQSSAVGAAPFRNFMDLVVSVSQALAATQVGLMSGTLYGSQFYLNQVATVSPTEVSPVTDQICQDMLTKLLPHQQYSWNLKESSSSWDPRVQTMYDLRRAIESCRRRQDFGMSSLSSLQETGDKTTSPSY